jgi:serine/threonine protein kinase
MTEIHSVGPFILGKSLGSGSTGKVKLGFHKDTGFKVAIKIMNKEVLSSRPSMRKKVEREIVVMKVIDHPNVLKLHDVYETSKYLFLVTEYVEGGELFDYLINKGSLEPMEALKFFQQLIRGLDHCHSQRICHRDLKPENLLLDSDKNIKIGDFGMAALMRRGALLGTSCGSPHYASPEVVTGKQYSGMTADVWSCGVILYALLTGKLPFDDDDIRKLLGKVKSGVFTMPAFLPKDSQDLISKMLTVDPSKRITIQQIKEHPWFNSNSPEPHNFLAPVSVEDMTASPLEDAAAIDDEILRSLKVLGLGSDMDIEHSLTSRKPNLTLVFYRLLEDRKEKQANNSYNHATRANRNRSNTHDSRERSYSEHVRSPSYQEGKTRSNSFTQNEGNGAVTRVLSLNSKQRRPSPLVDAKRNSGSGSQGLIFPISPSTSTNNTTGASTTTFTVSEDTATIVSIADSSSSEFHPSPNPVASPPLTRTSPPLSRDKDKDKFRKFSQSPPASPPPSQHMSTSSPINISNKFRIMQLANENSSQLGSSPIIGSNPKRSWFSNFFTGSPHAAASPLDAEDGGPNSPSLSVRDQPVLTAREHAQSPSFQHRDSHHNNNHHNNYNNHNNYNHSRDNHSRDNHSRDNHNYNNNHNNYNHNNRDNNRDNHHYNNHNSYNGSSSPHYSHHNSHHNNNHNNNSSSYNTSYSNYVNGSHHNSPSFSRSEGHESPRGYHSPRTSEGYESPRGFHHNRQQQQQQQQNNSNNFNIANNSNDKKDAPAAARTSMEMQTGKTGIELGAEIQRTLSALKTSWRLHTNELYTAKYDGAEGTTCQFSVELIDLKHNNLNLISVSHLAGTHSFFETLCTQFQAEVKL